MRDVWRQPAWRARDLGCRLPDRVHATSAAIPLWSQVIGYEEGDPAIAERLCQGYPRFVIHPLISQLTASLGLDPEGALPFPSERVARRALAFAGGQGRLIRCPRVPLVFVEVAPSAFGELRRYWQHTGEIVSSRWAEHIGTVSRSPENSSEGSRDRLRHSLACLADGDPEDVFLFPTGMAAIFTVLRVLWRCLPGRPTVQFGFPYVDSLALQKKMGPGCHFIAGNGPRDLEALAVLLRGEPPAAVLCECPANPLMGMPDLEGLSALLRPRGIPLVVDNTLDSFDRIKLRGIADIVVTSLSKFLSGKGDVMGGSLIIMPDSPWIEALHPVITEEAEDLLFEGDVEALADQILGFRARMQRINQNASALADHLGRRKDIKRLYRADQTARGRRLLGSDPGFGGIFSLTLEGGEAATRRFYDRLACNKGPGLGTRFTLVCPYTQLAHYHELAWADEMGVPPELIRVSVGTEPIEEIIARFDAALSPW